MVLPLHTGLCSVAKLDTYHGTASGVVQADEHLAGFMPSHGTELCGVVEAMFSYETAGQIIGDPFFFERAERIAYNALPATLVRVQAGRVGASACAHSRFNMCCR